MEPEQKWTKLLIFRKLFGGIPAFRRVNLRPTVDGRGAKNGPEIRRKCRVCPG